MNEPATPMDAYMILGNQPNGPRIIAALEKIKVLSLRCERRRVAPSPKLAQLGRVK